MRPLVKLTSSRICSISSHPAVRRAGVMNLVQMSRSLSAALVHAPHAFPIPKQISAPDRLNYSNPVAS